MAFDQPLEANRIVAKDTDWLVFSYLTVRDLGALSLASKPWAKFILCEAHDERLWSEAAKEFIEWAPNSTLPAKAISKVFAGYRELLKYRKSSTVKPDWDTIRRLDSEQTAQRFHPYLQNVRTTLFFLDYYSSQGEERPKYLMTQAHLGLGIAGWHGSYRSESFGTTRTSDDDDSFDDVALAQGNGPYARKCRPAIMEEGKRVLVQVSAIDLSKRGQFCREMLLEQYEFSPDEVQSTRTPVDDRFCVSDRPVYLSPGDSDDDPYMTWNDNWFDQKNLSEERYFSSAAWVVYSKVLPCFFSSGKQFLDAVDDEIVEENPTGAQAHHIIKGRHAAGKPTPANPVLAAHLDGHFDLARMHALYDVYKYESIDKWGRNPSEEEIVRIVAEYRSRYAERGYRPTESDSDDGSENEMSTNQEMDISDDEVSYDDSDEDEVNYLN